jgi:hypothetical protein
MFKKVKLNSLEEAKLKERYEEGEEELYKKMYKGYGKPLRVNK